MDLQARGSSPDCHSKADFPAVQLSESSQKLRMDSHSNQIGLKIATNISSVESMRWRPVIVNTGRYPLTIESHDDIPQEPNHNASMMTASSGQGTLARLLHSPSKCGDQHYLNRPNRSAKVTMGIALARRFRI
jgi:hypothetical protein